MKRMALMEQSYSVEEIGLIARGMKLLDAFDSAPAAAKELQIVTTMDSARKTYDARMGRVLAMCRAVMRASPQHVVAYMMEYDSRHLRSTWNPQRDVRTEILEIVNEHHIVVCTEKCAGVKGILNRTFLNSFVWKQLSAEPVTFCLVAVPVERHERLTPESRSRDRASHTGERGTLCSCRVCDLLSADRPRPG